MVVVGRNSSIFSIISCSSGSVMEVSIEVVVVVVMVVVVVKM